MTKTLVCIKQCSSSEVVALQWVLLCSWHWVAHRTIILEPLSTRMVPSSMHADGLPCSQLDLHAAGHTPPLLQFWPLSRKQVWIVDYCCIRNDKASTTFVTKQLDSSMYRIFAAVKSHCPRMQKTKRNLPWAILILEPAWSLSQTVCINFGSSCLMQLNVAEVCWCWKHAARPHTQLGE